MSSFNHLGVNTKFVDEAFKEQFPELHSKVTLSENKTLLFFNYVFNNIDDREQTWERRKHLFSFIACHPETSPITLEKMAEDEEDKTVINCLTSNPNLPLKARQTIISRETLLITAKLTLLKHPNITRTEIFDILRIDEEGRYMTASLAIEAADGKYDDVMDYVYEKYSHDTSVMRTYLEAASAKPENIQHFVETHGVTYYDFLVARNLNTPLEVLQATLKSEEADDDLRLDIAVNVSERNLPQCAGWPVEWIENMLEELLPETEIGCTV